MGTRICHIWINTLALCQLRYLALILAVSLFCQYLCPGTARGASQKLYKRKLLYNKGVRDHNSIYHFIYLFVTNIPVKLLLYKWKYNKQTNK